METITTDFQKPIYQPYPKAKKNELHKYIKKKKKKEQLLPIIILTSMWILRFARKSKSTVWTECKPFFFKSRWNIFPYLEYHPCCINQLLTIL